MGAGESAGLRIPRAAGQSLPGRGAGSAALGRPPLPACLSSAGLEGWAMLPRTGGRCACGRTGGLTARSPPPETLSRMLRNHVQPKTQAAVTQSTRHIKCTIPSTTNNSFLRAISESACPLLDSDESRRQCSDESITVAPSFLLEMHTRYPARPRAPPVLRTAVQIHRATPEWRRVLGGLWRFLSAAADVADSQDPSEFQHASVFLRPLTETFSKGEQAHLNCQR